MWEALTAAIRNAKIALKRSKERMREPADRLDEANRQQGNDGGEMSGERGVNAYAVIAQQWGVESVLVRMVEGGKPG